MTTRFEDHLLTGVHGSRPAAAAVPSGTLYSCTTHGLVYQSDGANWATWAAISGSSPVIQNEIQNFPSIEVATGARPSWWAVAANATLTEVDLSGEGGITDSYERVLKLVTTADSYGYQQLTYADQPRLRSGKVVSLRVPVWAVGGVTARIRLQSSVGSLGVAATTVASWTILEIPNITLDGTNIQIRLECATGTAYFGPPSFGLGTSVPVDLPPRGLVFRWRDPVSIKSLTGLGDEDAWTDIDVTSSTSNLAAVAVCSIILFDDDSTDSYAFNIRRNGSSQAKGNNTERARVIAATARQPETEFIVILDDAQIFEYLFDRVAGTGTLDYGEVFLQAWYEWA